MKYIQAAMHENLMAAIDGCQKLSQKRMGDAELQVKEIIALKYQMETIDALDVTVQFKKFNTV